MNSLKSTASFGRSLGRNIIICLICVAYLGAFKASAQKVFLETFEGLTLGPNVQEGLAGAKVWTKGPPPGWVADDSKVPGVGNPAQDGVTEWAGWSFANKNWWVQTAGDQRRSEFLLGQGTVMIADPDEWDDAAHVVGFLETYISTPPIAAQGAAANTLVLAFDSSWRPEGFDDGAPNWPVGPDGERINNQTGVITVSYDGGATTEVVRWDSDPNGPNFKADSEFINEAALIPLNNPAGVNNFVIKFGMQLAANDWWWAVDNIAVGVPPFITGVSADGVSFTVRITEGLGKTVDESKGITAELDGNPVTPLVVTRDGAAVTVKYSQAPEIFVPRSRHVVKVKFTNNDGKAIEDTVEFIAPGYTTLGVTPASVTATIGDTSFLTVDQARGVQFELDGTAVATASVNRSGANVVAIFSQDPQTFVPGSAHTIKVTFTTGAGKQVVETLEFTGPPFITVPGSLGTALGTGAQPGMRWRTHQLETARNGDTIARSELQLAGELGASVHDASGEQADGFFLIDYVNFDQVPGNAGNFRSNATPPEDVEDLAIPGIPGVGTDNIAAEALTFVEFPQAGVYTMVVNSDDGFQVSTGTSNSPNQIVLGKWDAGRGQQDTIFHIKIEKAGVYFMRLLWFEGGGDARVEWFTVNRDGSRALINGTQTGSLKAFRVRTVPEPTTSSTGIRSVALRDGKVEIAYTGTLKSATTVTGPYQAVANATTPYQATPDEAQRFYIAE